MYSAKTSWDGMLRANEVVLRGNSSGILAGLKNAFTSRNSSLANMSH